MEQNSAYADKEYINSGNINSKKIKTAPRNEHLDCTRREGCIVRGQSEFSSVSKRTHPLSAINEPWR
jgi:hypothetical protein